MRRLIYGLAAAALVVPLVVGASVVANPSAAPSTEFMVFYADGGRRAAVAAIEANGGRAVSTEPKLGYVLAQGAGAAFADALGRSDAIVGISTDRVIGYSSAALAARGRGPSAGTENGTTATGAPSASPAQVGGGHLTASTGKAATGTLNASTGKVSAGGRLSAAEGVAHRAVAGSAETAGGRSKETAGGGSGETARGGPKETAGGAFPDGAAVRGSAAEPLAARQWDMRMIGADRANRVAPGSNKVLVGVIDTGVDGKHPDIAPNFNRALSRNFVTDRPKDRNGEKLDGPCEYKGCKDPADIDDDGHGTHVASTIASPLNGKGIAGVAPNVQLVNLRAGLDSGYFFLKPALDALTYAADNGIDVVNMSFYIDPWLFNCRNNKADSRRERLEQRGIITGMQRALDYARGKGVTLIAALGNSSTDLGNPRSDGESPNFPTNSSRSRSIDNSCLNVPIESEGVVSVSSLGPSGRKAIYSNYGVEQADLSAPGGDTLDGKGVSPTRSILAAAPEAALRRANKINKRGEPQTATVVRDCHGTECAYYQYLDGTSMAAPHATGVAAIIISRFGRPGAGGVTMDPASVERLLYATATPKGCPSPRAFEYRYFGQKETHTCEGDEAKNGFYGKGVINAYRAATISQ
ncbi:S8 family serine peptidase [Nonomuraea africana]|uniref:Peptidase S8/S53 domain-containing protein n=1 Tax=Nonomuraea africana TaxID=46171 RepID=A0ABR9KH56_9ACTN|nr:S8 family serine peptidase [Nonomuraea africana]MBE1561347.1 hypothetical protein [Nonomuraea africana]